MTTDKDMAGWASPHYTTKNSSNITDDDAWLNNFPRRYRKVIRDTPSPDLHELSAQKPAANPTSVPSSPAASASPVSYSPQVEVADIRQQMTPHQLQRSYQRKRESGNFSQGYHNNLLHKDVNDAFLRAQLACNAAPVAQHIQPEVMERVSADAVTIKGLEYDVVIDGDVVHIGCLSRTIEQWGNLSQSDIASIDGKRALDFWHKYRHILSQMAQLQNNG